MLKYKWTAQLKDGSFISQFDENNREVNLRIVLDLDKERKLAMFHFSFGEKNIAVDLETGLFYFGEYPIKPDSSLVFKDEHYRLIYFMRSRKELSFGGTSREDYLFAYLIGWQIVLDGKNYQRIMYFYPNDNSIEIKSKR